MGLLEAQDLERYDIGISEDVYGRAIELHKNRRSLQICDLMLLDLCILSQVVILAPSEVRLLMNRQ